MEITPVWTSLKRFAGFVPDPPKEPVESAADREARYAREHIENMRRAHARLPSQTRELSEARRWAHAVRGVACGTGAFPNGGGRWRELPGQREIVGELVVEWMRAVALTKEHFIVVGDQHDHRTVFLQAYRRDLERQAVEEVDVWIEALKVEGENTRHAVKMGDPIPTPLKVPEQVRREIDRRAAEKARQAARARGAAGGGQKPRLQEDEPPKGPKRAA